MKKFILYMLLCLYSAMPLADVAAIKNYVPSTSNTITRMEVYWMYTMRTRFWPNGQKITVFYMDYGNPIHEEFVYKVLKSTPTAFAQSVQVYINSGNAGYFRQVPPGTKMQSSVANTVGSIGYLNKDIIMINKGSGDVQTLNIID